MSMISKVWNSNNIRIRSEDRYVCLSDLASASGKLLADWLRLKGTKVYLASFSEAMGIPIAKLVEVQNGNETFAHPEIAIDFAKWCSVELRIWVNRQIDELLTTGSVSLEQPKLINPSRDTVDWVNCSKYIEDLNDPILKSALMQSLYEDLQVRQLPQAEQIRHAPIAVIARENGYTLKPGQDAQLGKYALKHLTPTGKIPHGRYDVNTYEVCNRTLEVIASFFR